jgi:2-beta-glucuronyltransferase
MKRLVLITGHFPMQKRRTSMLWVTDHLQAQGWHVTYVTVGYSWLSRLKRDKRLGALGYKPKQGAETFGASLTAIYGLSPIHPFKWRSQALNTLSEPLTPLFIRYWGAKLRAPLQNADIVICESGAPVLLAPLIKQHAPGATRIYRVSDDIRLLNAPDVLLRAEAAHHHFHRISTGSPLIAQRFTDHPNVTIDPMGVPHAQLNVRTNDPYTRQPNRQIAICAGSTLLDMTAVARTAHKNPNWQIHVIGRLKSMPPALPNVTWHGEQPFAKTLAYIQHADIGLAPFQDVPGVEYQITNSNRILLYRYYGLPILVPGRLCTPGIPSLISDSAPDGPGRCESYGRQPESIPDWSALADALVQNGVTDPPDVSSTVPDTIVNPLVNTVPPLASSA